MAIVAVELDLAKNVFAVHGVDAAGTAVRRIWLTFFFVLFLARQIRGCAVGRTSRHSCAAREVNRRRSL